MSVEELRPDAIQAQPVVEANDRSEFLKKTYMHLLGAVLLFAGLEWALFQTPYAAPLAIFMLEKSWLAVLGGFIIVSWIASSVAHKVESVGAQYLALGLFIVAEAIIFIPMLFIAVAVGEGMLQSAVMVTLGAFVALSAVAVYSGRDFSFLRGLKLWAGLTALGTIAMGAVMGFHLGTWFSMAMIGIAGASVLYDTSKIVKTYPDDRYIAAALELFASFALMLWYVLRLFLARR